MIIALVPSPTRLPVGTVLNGSTEESVLPIGNILTITDAIYNSFYKMYAQFGNFLYEYSLFRVNNINVVNSEPLYIPLSVKRYNDAYEYTHTYLYLNGIKMIRQMFKGGNLEYDIVSAGCLIQNIHRLANNLEFDKMPDSSITIDSPEVIENLLQELGNYRLIPGNEDLKYALPLINDVESTYQEELDILSNRSHDVITNYACTSYPYISESLLNSLKDVEYCNLYNNIVADGEARACMYNKGLYLYKLDKSMPEYYDFEFEKIITELFTISNTDVYIEFEVGNYVGTLKQKYSLFTNIGQTTPYITTMLTKRLHWDTLQYNKTHVMDIVKISLLKTWLDELYFSIYYNDGTCRTFFLNLCMYHVYTPSVIQVYPN